MNSSEHWNKIYSTKTDCELGWYEKDLSYSLNQVKKIPLNTGSNVFIAGAGRTKIIDYFIELKCNVIVNDISNVAIQKMQMEYNGTENIRFISGDVCDVVFNNSDIALWFDRAVLHFITDDLMVERYFKNCAKSIRKNGFVIFSEFATDGADKCAGLSLRKYEETDFIKRMKGFDLVNCENTIYVNPAGQERKYINCIMKKSAQQSDASETMT